MEKEKKKLEGAGDSAARFSYALLRLREGYAHVAFAVLAEAYARRYGNAQIQHFSRELHGVTSTVNPNIEAGFGSLHFVADFA
jgi:hypothetical protein